MFRCSFSLLLVTLVFAGVSAPVAAQMLGQFRTLPPLPDEEVIRDADDKVRISVGFKLCVDARGQIACLEPLSDQNPAVVNEMLRRVPSWRFSAATRDGRPASAETTLWISLEGEPDTDGRFQMRVAGSGVGPRAARRVQPRYPARELRSLRAGGVLVRAHVVPDGSLQQLEVVDEFSDKAFAKATLAALEKWTFVPERIDGEAVASTIMLPVVYSIIGRPAPRLRWKQQIPALGVEPLALDSPITLLAGPDS